jgi:hypothetical protein
MRGLSPLAKLVQHQAFALGLHLVGHIAGTFHASRLGGEDEFSAKSLHGLRTFDGQVLGHDEHHTVALDGRCHCQGNTGIARSGFNQGIARANISRSSAR